MAMELQGLLASEYDVVEIVQDGDALIEAVLRVQPDAIVCDIAMPGVSGLSAAASILAKVTRDHWMIELDARYPGYGFARHKGYGTRDHQAALQSIGTCTLHRKTFKPIHALLDAA